MRSLFIFLFVTAFVYNMGSPMLYAAKGCDFGGKVVGENDGEGISNVVVSLKELNLWQVTNEKGNFLFEHVKPGHYTLYVSCLGYATIEQKTNISGNSTENIIKLEITSLSLEEVIVTAKEQELESVSVIEQSAMEHLQPKSMYDAMQLLPGHLSENPDLARPKQLKIRMVGYQSGGQIATTSETNTSALGAAVIIDGAPVSNNSNMQVYSTVKSGTTFEVPGVAGRGIDLRELTTDNVESIEVIRGIPSVEYGDLTSGAVVVKTKSGKTPYEVRVAIDPGTKMVSLGKGFSMNNHGVLNVNLDYTSSYPDVRKKYKGYKRLTTNLGYSNTFFQKNKPLLFNLRLALFTTVDDEKSDPQLKNNEVITANKDGLRAAINGKWLLNSKWITNLSYNFSANYAHQHDYLKKLKTITAGTMPLATSLKHGEHTAQFLPAEYYSELTVDGKPFDIFARVMGNLSLTKSQVNNNIVYGAEWRANGNKGDGRIFDLNYPPEINSISTIRERSYKERPTLHSLALFVEDNVGNDLLRIQAGLRYNNFQPVNIFDSEKKTIEPRINIKYSFIRYEEKKLFSELSVFGGYGIQSKSPTLAHLYPDNAYFDLNSFNYFSNNADERLLLVSTRIIDPTDKLEPIEVSKIEIGFDGKVKGMKFIFTGYYEKSDNGLTFTTHHNFIEFGKWNTDDTNIIYREEAPPIIDLNALTEVDTFTAKYAKPQNTHIIIKKGLEYRFDFDKIKFLNTSFNNSRAYLYTKNYNGSETYMLLYGDGANQPPYVGIYAACEGRERQRFNTNFVAITHLPKLRLAFSTTLQVLWKSRYRYFLGGRQLWEYSTDNTNYLIEAPIALIDKEGVRREISKDEIFSQEYDYYISKYREEYYQVENQPIHYQLNPKVTSEIGEKAKFAFFANNFTMLNPTYKSKRTNSVFTLNSPVYY